MEKSGCSYVLILFCRLDAPEYDAWYLSSNGKVLGATPLISIWTEAVTEGILMPAADSNALLVHGEAEVKTSGRLTGSKLLSEPAFKILEEPERWLSITAVMETSDGSVPHAGGMKESSGFLSTECKV